MLTITYTNRLQNIHPPTLKQQGKEDRWQKKQN